MKVRRKAQNIFRDWTKNIKLALKFLLSSLSARINGEQYLQNANKKKEKKRKEMIFTKQYYTQVNTQIGGKKITFYKMQRLYMKKLLEHIHKHINYRFKVDKKV